MAKKGIGGVISGSIILFLGAIIITAGVAGRAGVNTFLINDMLYEGFTGLEDQGLDALEPSIKQFAYAEYMQTVYDQMQYAFGGDPANLAAFIEGSTAAGVIFATADALHPSPPGPYADLNAALVGLFNDNIMTTYGTPIPGISEAMNAGAPIGYTLPMVGALCMGSGSPPFVGILEEDPLMDGTPGILVFLGTYQAALVDAPTMAAMLAAYGLPAQAMLDAVAGYIVNILYPITGALISGGLGWSDVLDNPTALTVGDYIIAQWAQMALISGGLGTLDPGAAGFEVNSVFSSFAQAESVWYSIMTSTKWYVGDSSIITDLSITQTIYNDVIAWIATLETPLLSQVAGMFGFPDDNHFERLLVNQWLNFTLGALEPALADGFIAYLMAATPDLTEEQIDLLNGTLFEVNMTTASLGEAPIDHVTAYAVWNEFTDVDGMATWLEATDKRGKTAYNGLMDTHGLTEAQMEFLCDYLDNFRTSTIFALNAMQPAEDQITLPIWGLDVEKALNDIELYLPIGGGVFACAGVLLIALFARKRA